MKNNLYSKILTILLIIFITVLIVISFINNNYHFNDHILIGIAFLIVLVLYDSFDSFNIGKIISLKKNIKQIKEEKDNLLNQNNMLISKIVNKNIVYNYVISGSNDIKDLANKNNVTDIIKSKHGTLYSKYLDILALNKLLNNIPNVKYNVEIKNNYEAIAFRKILFDAAIIDDNVHTFYEVTHNPKKYIKYNTSYYLKFISIYEELNKIKSKLILVVPVLDHSKNTIEDVNLLISQYQNEINNDLLEIKMIDVSTEEVKSLIKDSKNE